MSQNIQTPDYNQFHQQLIARAVSKIQHHYPDTCKDDIDFCQYQPLSKELIKETVANPALEKQLKHGHLHTAFHYPPILEGYCEIHVKDEIIFEVYHGKVLKDKLELVNYFQQQEIEQEVTNFRWLVNSMEGETMYARIKGLIERAGEVKPDGSKQYSSHKYHFEIKNKQLQVKSRDGKRIIFNQTGFTDEADIKDINRMLNLRKIVKISRNEKPKQAPKSKL